jgi:hypothetical protein
LLKLPDEYSPEMTCRLDNLYAGHLGAGLLGATLVAIR